MLQSPTILLSPPFSTLPPRTMSPSWVNSAPSQNFLVTVYPPPWKARTAFSFSEGPKMAVSISQLPLTISLSLNPPEYIITMPNMYARGILFGKMVLELGDTCIAKNDNNHLYCDLDFKTKVSSSSLLFPSLSPPLGFLFWYLQCHQWSCATRFV